MPATKIDLKKELKTFYNPSAEAPVLVDVPALDFIMIDGEGDPGVATAYADAVAALYGVAYAAKFALKAKGKTPDFSVMPLEGLWWSDDMDDFITRRRDRWKWTMMIAMPDFVKASDIDLAKAVAAKKKDNASIGSVRFERFKEGPAVQIMYFGAYSDEGPTIAALHQIIVDHGKQLSGLHHEIYLSDPRRTAPEKLKTVIRQPYA
jgi:hypothetical protein